METKILEIRQPDDFHTHLRWAEMLETVLSFTARVFARAVVMPNLIEQDMVLTARHVTDYYHAIKGACHRLSLPDQFESLMTIRIVPQTTPKVIDRAKAAGANVGKLYPDGVTHGSQGGVSDFKALYPVFTMMQELGMVLSIHCELPGVSEMEAEAAFIPVLVDLIKNFPNLRIVVEHVSSSAMVDFLLGAPKTVGATITAHHLVLTYDQVYQDGKIRWPHHYCKPVAKTEADQRYLVRMAISGNPRFWFGSDTAPHPRANKERDKPAAGVFSAPVALPVLAAAFEAAGALDRLENFVARFGAEFYGLPQNQGRITLRREPWKVPEEYGSFVKVVPLMAGQELPWRVIA